MIIAEVVKIASSFCKKKPTKVYEIRSGYIVQFGKGLDNLVFVSKKTKEAEIFFPPDISSEEYLSKRQVF